MALVNLSKQDFKNYRTGRVPDSFPSSSDTDRPSRDRPSNTFEYVNPHHDFRNYKINVDYLYILFSSSNFLHSGPFFNHLDVPSPSHNSVISFRHLLLYV